MYIIVLNGKSNNLLILHEYVGDVMLKETFRVWSKLVGWYIGYFMEKLPAFWSMQYLQSKIGSYTRDVCNAALDMWESANAVPCSYGSAVIVAL